MRNLDITPRQFHYNQQNFIPESPRPKKRKRLKWLIVLLVVFGGLTWGATKILSQTNKIFGNNRSIFTRVGQLFLADEKKLQGEENGMVNILLLGLGGPGHEAPNLTDTMIVASINTTTSEVVLTSIPRDFLVQLPNHGFNKINAAYAYAEKDKPGSGGEAAIAMVEKLTGLDIPYFASIDFKGFVKAVDHLGGLDITIERTFTDSEYPNYNLGYLPPVTFTKGTEHMDGERALIFARSRKGTNGEGSDFARSERQKKIMVGVKEKVSGLNVTDLGTLNSLLADFTDNVRTNLEPYELKRLAELGKTINSENVYSLSLDPTVDVICAGLIDAETGRWSPRPVAPPPPAAPTTTTDTDSVDTDTTTDTTAEPAEPVDDVVRIYVVQPCEGKTLEDINIYLSQAMNTASLQKENATIEVQNSTGKAYAVNPWTEIGTSAGINVKVTTFRGKTTYDRTILYDNSKGTKPRTLEYLKNTFNITVSDVPFYDGQETSDFVIILGKDAL